jgi:tetratricopeptide (TPR) repeat protein
VEKFDAPIEAATTSSLEALQAYSRGFEQHSSGKYDAAIRFYKDAIARDPYFAIAYARLGTCYNITKQNELSREAFQKAYDLRERGSEREKLFVSANYYGGVTGEWDRQIDQLEIWKRTYPKDPEPFILLANKYTLVGPFEKAIENAQEAIRLNPTDARPHANLAVAFIGLNRFDEAIDVLRRAVSQKLETTKMHARLYQIAFVKGDAAVMKDQLAWAASKPEEALTWQAQTSDFSGQLAKANQFNERAIELARQSGVKEIIAQVLLQQAGRSAAFGNCAPVSGIVTSALALSHEQANLAAAANALAACGQAAAAQANMDEVSKAFPQDTLLNTISIPIARAQLELNRGNAAQVIQLLEPAKRYEVAGEFWPQYLRGQAYLKQGDGAEAAAEFKTIVDHRGWYPVSPLYQLAELGSDRAAVVSGDKQRTRK